MIYLGDIALHNSSFKIPKVRNKTDNKPYEQFIIMQAEIEANKQDMNFNKQGSDEKMTNFTE